MSYQIRTVRAADREALNQFFREVYKPNHIVTDADYFNWQYLNVPGNQFAPNFSSLILLKDSQIIAQLGMIPYFFNVFGEEMRAAYLTNLIVREELRSRGAGVFLLREAEKYFDLVYTTSYNAAVAPIYRSLLWSEEAKMNRWVIESLSPNATDDRIATVEAIGEDWAKNWHELKRYFPITINRTPEYLNWRFLSNPKVQYQIFGIKPAQSGSGGLIVLRLERGSDFSAVRIVDLVARPDEAVLLLRAALNYAYDAQVNFVDFFSTSPIYDAAFQKLKFYLYDNKSAQPPIFILPTDRRKIFFNFSYKFTKNQPVFKSGDLFITKSDGDRDRPY